MTNSKIVLVLSVLALAAWMPAHAGEIEGRAEIARAVSALFEAENLIKVSCPAWTPGYSQLLQTR